MAHNAGTFGSGASTYQLVSGPVEGAISLVELKSWLKITNANQDTLLQAIIDAVTRSAELYTKRDFIQKEYKTKRDVFGDFFGSAIPPRVIVLSTSNDNPFELRRTPVQSIVSVIYLNTSNVQTTISASDYYFTETDGSEFSLLLPEVNVNWPNDLQTQRLQSIEIKFTAGWSTQTIFKLQWPDLYQALLAHMADVFVNRGDCSPGTVGGACGCESAPPQAKSVYDRYLIIDFAID